MIGIIKYLEMNELLLGLENGLQNLKSCELYIVDKEDNIVKIFEDWRDITDEEFDGIDEKIEISEDYSIYNEVQEALDRWKINIINSKDVIWGNEKQENYQILYELKFYPLLTTRGSPLSYGRGYLSIGRKDDKWNYNEYCYQDCQTEETAIYSTNINSLLPILKKDREILRRTIKFSYKIMGKVISDFKSYFGNISLFENRYSFSNKNIYNIPLPDEIYNSIHLYKNIKI